MTAYTVKKPGDVLSLHVTLPEADQGDYVLLSIGDTCCLARLGENEDGLLCSTTWLVDVKLAELSLFVPTGLVVDASL